MGARDKYRTIDSPVFTRGEPDKPGEVVPRGVLQVVGTSKPSFDKKSSGRLQVADWVASAENPLTARVFVNRVWLHLFGRGIVPTPDNFGAAGNPPSNQALLDHLAVTFAKEGWSTKKLIRQLVLSHAYRLSSKFDPANHETDPDNVLVWRTLPQRLDAEAVRDGILAVSGQLDTKPPVGSVIAKAGEGPSQRPQLLSSTRMDPNDPHRAVYLPVVRDNLSEVLALFDAADASLVVGDRPTTTVPSQALFLMNNQFVQKAADATAETLLKSTTTDTDRIRKAYQLFYARTPSEKELAAAEKFLIEYQQQLVKDKVSSYRREKEAWATFCQSLFASAEFLFRN